MISIFELSRKLKRKPISLKNGNSQLMARFLIEKKDQKEIEYNERAEERIGVVLDHFASFLGNYTVYNKEEEEETIRKSITQVIILIFKLKFRNFRKKQMK